MTETDRETERQRDRETEKDRDGQRQRDKERKDRDTERQRDRERGTGREKEHKKYQKKNCEAMTIMAAGLDRDGVRKIRKRDDEMNERIKEKKKIREHKKMR